MSQILITGTKGELAGQLATAFLADVDGLTDEQRGDTADAIKSLVSLAYGRRGTVRMYDAYLDVWINVTPDI